MRYDLTAQQVSAMVAMLPEDDAELRADMLEAETDLFEMVSRLLAWIEEDEGSATALAKQIEDRKVRAARFASRIDHKRDMITALMDIAKLKKMGLPEATISKRTAKAKLGIVDEKAVPDAYQVTKKTPDKKAINDTYSEALILPNWLVRLDPEDILTVRRK